MKQPKIIEYEQLQNYFKSTSQTQKQSCRQFVGSNNQEYLKLKKKTIYFNDNRQNRGKYTVETPDGNQTPNTTLSRDQTGIMSGSAASLGQKNKKYSEISMNGLIQIEKNDGFTKKDKIEILNEKDDTTHSQHEEETRSVSYVPILNLDMQNIQYSIKRKQDTQLNVNFISSQHPRQVKLKHGNNKDVMLNLDKIQQSNYINDINTVTTLAVAAEPEDIFASRFIMNERKMIINQQIEESKIYGNIKISRKSRQGSPRIKSYQRPKTQPLRSQCGDPQRPSIMVVDDETQSTKADATPLLVNGVQKDLFEKPVTINIIAPSRRNLKTQRISEESFFKIENQQQVEAILISDSQKKLINQQNLSNRNELYKNVENRRCNSTFNKNKVPDASLQPRKAPKNDLSHIIKSSDIPTNEKTQFRNSRSSFLTLRDQLPNQFINRTEIRVQGEPECGYPQQILQQRLKQDVKNQYQLKPKVQTPISFQQLEIDKEFLEDLQKSQNQSGFEHVNMCQTARMQQMYHQTTLNSHRTKTSKQTPQQTPKTSPRYMVMTKQPSLRWHSVIKNHKKDFGINKIVCNLASGGTRAENQINQSIRYNPDESYKQILPLNSDILPQIQEQAKELAYTRNSLENKIITYTTVSEPDIDSLLLEKNMVIHSQYNQQVFENHPQDHISLIENTNKNTNCKTGRSLSGSKDPIEFKNIEVKINKFTHQSTINVDQSQTDFINDAYTTLKGLQTLDEICKTENQSSTPIILSFDKDKQINTPLSSEINSKELAYKEQIPSPTFNQRIQSFGKMPYQASQIKSKAPEYITKPNNLKQIEFPSKIHPILPLGKLCNQPTLHFKEKESLTQYEIGLSLTKYANDSINCGCQKNRSNMVYKEKLKNLSDQHKWKLNTSQNAVQSAFKYNLNKDRESLLNGFIWENNDRRRSQMNDPRCNLHCQIRSRTSALHTSPRYKTPISSRETIQQRLLNGITLNHNFQEPPTMEEKNLFMPEKIKQLTYQKSYRQVKISDVYKNIADKFNFNTNNNYSFINNDLINSSQYTKTLTFLSPFVPPVSSNHSKCGNLNHQPISIEVSIKTPYNKIQELIKIENEFELRIPQSSKNHKHRNGPSLSVLGKAKLLKPMSIVKSKLKQYTEYKKSELSRKISIPIEQVTEITKRSVERLSPTNMHLQAKFNRQLQKNQSKTQSQVNSN